MGAGTRKGANETTLQKDYEFFLVFFTLFHMKDFEWKIL